MRIWSSLNWDTACPLTVSDGRNQFAAWAEAHPLVQVPEQVTPPPVEEPCMVLDKVWFRYEKGSPDILKGVSMKAYPGELLCILGGNGTGKSTTLSVLSGVRSPYRGKMICKGKKVTALPQNPQMLLVKKNVREELLSVFPGKKPREVADRVGELVSLCRLEGLLDRHPYDLSGGEQQRVALAKVLLQDPEILLLDEPTKGVNNEFKLTFARILKELTARGICVIMVSHDVEFCAKYADRCGLFFDGSIVTMDAPQPFFAGKSFYTTFLMFEGRKPQARELVILSVLSALAIGGRAVFFALPGFKPVAAMVILTGVAFGGEAGFMVGSMTMFCSNVLFGQGPWTPWQMFAMGIMGLLAGILFRKGLLHRERLSLSVFGGLVTFLVYGGIMNPASVLMYQANPDWQMILTACITGVPADAVHALATAMFLWFLSEPMLEKLDRVKVKYGLLEK